MVFDRVIWIVLDSVGIGEMPDAADYGDCGSDTLGNIASRRSLDLPNLCSLGLANIRSFTGLTSAMNPAGAFGRCALASPGKDTTTGHWEMAGIHLEKPLPLFLAQLFNDLGPGCCLVTKCSASNSIFKRPHHLRREPIGEQR